MDIIMDINIIVASVLFFIAFFWPFFIPLILVRITWGRVFSPRYVMILIGFIILLVYLISVSWKWAEGEVSGFPLETCTCQEIKIEN